MVQVTLTQEMRETLARMKGKTLKSYECFFPGAQRSVIGSKVRMSLGGYAVDLCCRPDEVDGWEDVFGDDPPYGLACEERPLDSCFSARDHYPTTVQLVGERIVGVDIVSYAIEEDDALEAIIDMAVVVRTKRSAYTFSRDIWFSFVFHVSEGGDAIIPFTEEKCAEAWAGEPDEGEPSKVRVTRTVAAL